MARTRPSELPSGLSETVIRSPGPCTATKPVLIWRARSCTVASASWPWIRALVDCSSSSCRRSEAIRSRRESTSCWRSSIRLISASRLASRTSALRAVCTAASAISSPNSTVATAAPRNGVRCEAGRVVPPAARRRAAWT